MRRQPAGASSVHLATTAAPGKEVRVAGIGDAARCAAARGLGALVSPGGARCAGDRRRGTRWPGRCSAPRYVGAVVFVPRGSHSSAGRRAAGAGGRRAAVGVHRRHGRRDRLPARHLDGRLPAPRLARGLRRRAGRARPTCRCRTVSRGASASSTSRSPIRAPTRLVLEDVTLDLPAGAVVAIVGENGAGKTTLVKLLAKMYEPTRGRILVDERRSGAHAGGRVAGQRLAGAFQDFFRFEFLARHTVGVGDVPRLDDEPGGRDRGRPRRRRRRGGAAAGRARDAARPDLARTASRCRSASGRSSRSRAASCASSRCCSCSTSRPPRSTPRPSTRCSSATRPRARGRTVRAQRPHHAPGVASLLHRADGRSHRRARRRARRRGGHARGADGEARAVRRALLDSGGGLSIGFGLSALGFGLQRRT